MKNNKILLHPIFLFCFICFWLPSLVAMEGKSGDPFSEISSTNFHVYKVDRSVHDSSISSIEKIQSIIPLEILYQICYKLPPKEIIYLSMASKYFNEKITNMFWENYINIRKQIKLDQSIPAVLVAFAYSLLEERKAESLAEALEILKKKGKKQKKRHKIKKVIRSALRNSHLTPSTDYFLLFGLPLF